MEGTIINKATQTVQVYMEHTTSVKNSSPNLKDYKSGQLTNVSSMSSADIGISGDGDYVYCAIWKIDTITGNPDTWLVYTKENGTIKASHFKSFMVQISGSENTGWIITISNRSGSSNQIYIALIVFVLLFLVGIAIGIYFMLRKNSGTTMIGAVDTPIFEPEY